MSTITDLAKQAQDYLRAGKELVTNYVEYKDKLNKQLEKQQIGVAYLRESLYNRREEIEDFLTEGARVIEANIERTKERELELIESTQKPVTADMVAELDMLEKTIVEGEDISKYLNKYKDTPLAMKRLKNIAVQNKTNFHDVKSKAEQLDIMLNNIKSHVDYAKTPRYDSVSIEWVLEGSAEHIERDLEIYKSL